MTVTARRMLDHCAKLLDANQRAYVDPDTLAMARFIIEALGDNSSSLERLRRALAEALDLFDAAWCPEHGHAPTPAQIARAAELRELVQP